jgi:hypothetical protein
MDLKEKITENVFRELDKTDKWIYTLYHMRDEHPFRKERWEEILDETN